MPDNNERGKPNLKTGRRNEPGISPCTQEGLLGSRINITFARSLTTLDHKLRGGTIHGVSAF